MRRMDNTMDLLGGMEEFVVPGSLFESLESLDYDNNNTSMEPDLFSGLELDISSDTMASFLEMENIPEVETVRTMEPVMRPSVIKKNIKMAEEQVMNLGDILTSCGIEYDMVESDTSAVSSPASSHSDMESDMERNQELINDLENFFMRTEGKPTVVEDVPVQDTMMTPAPLTNSITLEELNNAVTTNMVTDDGQKVVFIIAPSSPSDSVQSSMSPRQLDSDPEWSPSPASEPSPGPSRPRKKYQRSKPPKCPSGPYPTDKAERKKAQNRTAAFRYREKMKSQQDCVEEELEALEERNINLKEKLAEMETEFKYLKKLMQEAGLGQFAAAVTY